MAAYFSAIELVCSAYCGQAGETTSEIVHWNKADTGSPAVETTTVPPGATAAWRFNGVAAAVCKEFAPTATTDISASFWMYIDTSLPSATAYLFRADQTGTDAGIRLSTGGVLIVKHGSSSANVTTLSVNTWYRVALRFDGTAGAGQAFASVYDAAGALIASNSATGDATGSGNYTRVRIGNQAAVTLNVVIGRILVSTADEYTAFQGMFSTYGIGTTKGFTVGTTSGTHVNPSSLTLSTGGSPSNGDSSGGLVDDAWPPNTTDYVAQTTIDGSAYWEGIFATSGETSTPIVVESIVGVFATTTTNSDWRVRIHDGSGFNVLPTATSHKTTPRAYTEQWMQAPSGVDWTPSLFQALRIRFGLGGGNVTPNPRLTGTLLEAELGAAALAHPDYLIWQEDGASGILLEDGTSFLLREEAVTGGDVGFPIIGGGYYG